jgi:hypothetical protein
VSAQQGRQKYSIPECVGVPAGITLVTSVEHTELSLRLDVRAEVTSARARKPMPVARVGPQRRSNYTQKSADGSCAPQALAQVAVVVEP